MQVTVAVIGAGVVGSLLARKLTEYELSVALIEAREDVATGATGANSAIAHGGFDPQCGTLKARLNVRGTAMMPRLCEELGVPYRANGSMVLAFSEQEMESVRALYERGKRNGVNGLSVLSGDELRALEPHISENVCGGLRCTSSGILCPYGLAIAAAGNAMDNGASLLLSSPVTAIEQTRDGFVLTAGETQVQASYVVNCAGVYADEVARLIGDDSFTIRPRKGEYLLFDSSEGGLVGHTLFQVPSKAGKGILVTPTVHGNLLIGPTSDFVEQKDDRSTTREGLERVKAAALRSVDSLQFKQVITAFAGVRAVPDAEDFIIRPSEVNGRFLHAAGIESPGLSASPAIAEYLVELLREAGMPTKPNAAFNPIRKSQRWFRALSDEEKNEVIRNDPRYGRVVCRCETITEGEIVDAIHRAPPAYTVDALKHRLRTGMGRCQGGFCTPLITEILARETGLPPQMLNKGRAGSYLLVGSTKS